MSLGSLSSERLQFVPIEAHSLEDLFAYGSDEAVSKYIGWPLFKTFEDAKVYHQSLIERVKKNTHMYAGIRLKGSDKTIGTVMLFAFDHDAKNAELGYVLHKSYWGQKIASEVIKMLCDYAEKELGLHRLHARVVDLNIGSSGVLLKNHFKEEGRLIDHYYIDGQYCDGLLYGRIFK